MRASGSDAAISFRASSRGELGRLHLGQALACKAALALATALFAGTAGAQGFTTLVSSASGGEQGNSASTQVALSSDGRFYTFVSAASNLVSGDTNGVNDIFVKDLWTSVTVRASVDSFGNQANGPSGNDKTAISDDGRYVVFASEADNLVPGDTNGNNDLFLRDLLLGQTTRISVDGAGLQVHGNSDDCAISADARFVACDSDAVELWAWDTNDEEDVIVFDLATGTPVCASVAPSGQASNGESLKPAISADGRWVAFSSSGSDLVANDTNDTWDIFLRDMNAGVTWRVSVDSAGNQANDMSSFYRVDVSDDGRYVSFMSLATNLVPGDTNGVQDVFVHDHLTGQTVRVNVDSAGQQALGGGSAGCSLSSDGRFVAFGSYAANLVAGDTNDSVDIFLHDQLTGLTQRVSLGNSGQQANSASNNPRVCGDGHLVAFQSDADNLIPGDTNASTDVFVRDVQQGCGWIIGNYCMSAVNSTGLPARIGYQGTALISQNDLVLQVSDGVPFKPGIFFFGSHETQIPFGEGYLCVTGSQHRLAPVVRLDAFGAGSFALDFTDPLSAASLISAGSNWNFQFWYRDPQPVGHGFNLSDALKAQFCP